MKKQQWFITPIFAAILAVSFMACDFLSGSNGNNGTNPAAQHEAVFDSCGGSGVAGITNIENGAKIAKPAPDPVYAGYIFEGWYQEILYIRLWDFDADTVTADITLYAKWREDGGGAQPHTHDFGDWAVTTAPSCTQAGEEARACAADGTHLETRPIPALGHDGGAWITAVQPACISDGLKELRCTVCGAVLNTETIPALGHDFSDWAVTTAPSCTQAGEEARACAADGTHLETRPIPALGHDGGAWVTAVQPACASDGLKELRCTVCGAVLNTETIPALGHDFGDWTVTTAPSCTQAGEEAWACANNSTHLETRPIPALGHDGGAWITAVQPACASDGLKELRCTVCGAVLNTETIPALGHDWEWVVTTPATETADGIERGVCRRCGDTGGTRILYALGTAGLSYTLIHDGTAYSVSAGSAKSGAVFIPAYHDGLPVTAVGAGAFSGCGGLTSVTIADGVTAVGAGAFSDCVNLTNAALPDSLTDIAFDALLRCTSLEQITMNRTVVDAFLNRLCEYYLGAPNLLTVNWDYLDNYSPTVLGGYIMGGNVLYVRKQVYYSIYTFEVVLHEFRHFYQYVAAFGFGATNFDSMTVPPTQKEADEWRLNFQNYIDSSNFAQYWNQPVEADARAFAALFTGIVRVYFTVSAPLSYAAAALCG